MIKENILKLSRIEAGLKPELKCDLCFCSDCNETFKIDDCPIDAEYNEYTGDYMEFPSCPKCEDGGCINDYFPSQEVLDEYNKNKNQR